MSLVLYLIVYPILRLISMLPWRIFYGFSTLIYFLVYFFLGYRKKTVTENLQLAFPDKSEKEIINIRKAFYKHMCDMFLEMIKTLSISKKAITERFKLVNPEKLKELEDKNESIIAMMGHYNSYEWTNSLDIISKFTCVGIYKPIKNKYFDKLAHKIRGRFGSRLVPSFKTSKVIAQDESSTDPSIFIYGLIADQSPKLNKTNVWIDFLGHKVPTFIGGEVLAKRHDLSVFYLHVTKVKRGFYEAELIPLSEKPSEEEPFHIIKKFTALLEEQILSKPENYLWTHKRWKHREAKIPESATVI